MPLLPTPGSGPVVCSSCGPVTTRCGTFFLVLFVVLLLCYVDPVRPCDHILGHEGPVCFAFLWFVPCVLSALVCLLFLLVSLLGYFL